MKVAPYFLEGAFLALNAIPDAYAVIDSPHCEMERAYKIGIWSDRFSNLAGHGAYAHDRRVYPADWESIGEIRGTEEELRRALETVASRHPGKRIFLLRSFLSMMIFTDLQGLSNEISEKTGSPISIVHQSTLDDDWVDGYRRVNECLIELIVQDQGADTPLVSGFSLLRNEADEIGNVAEIMRLWNALDLPQPRWLFDGKNPSLDPVSKNAVRIIFPFDFEYDGEEDNENFLKSDFPIGVEATTEFLEALARRFDRMDLAEKFIDSEKQRIRPLLQPSVHRSLAGKGAIVVGDPWRARGLWRALRELGLDVPLVVSTRKAGAVFPKKEELEARGTEVWVDPDFNELRDYLGQSVPIGLVDFFVGSGTFRDIAKEFSLAYLESGFPCYTQHFITPSPIMGFEGILHLAQRLDNASAEQKYLFKK